MKRPSVIGMETELPNSEGFRFEQETRGEDVDFLEVELDPNRQLRRMRATTQQDNPLFYTQRHLQLTTTPTPDQPRIKSYRIAGVQKLVLSDSVRYSLEAEVRY